MVWQNEKTLEDSLFLNWDRFLRKKIDQHRSNTYLYYFIFILQLNAID